MGEQRKKSFIYVNYAEKKIKHETGKLSTKL